MSLAPDRSRLTRVLEPEAMDSSDESREYDAMDHGEVNRRFVAELLVALRAAGLPDDVEVLDLGTGTARIPIELCRQNPKASVLAIDLAEEMLRLAERNVEAAGLGGQIRLQQVDAKRMPFADGQFAVVMSNSIVHHIPEPRTALAEAVRVLRSPDGLLLVRDLARPFDDAQVRELGASYAAGCSDRQRQLFDDSLRAALSVEEIRQLATDLGCDPQGVTATSDRHWTWHQVTH